MLCTLFNLDYPVGVEMSLTVNPKVVDSIPTRTKYLCDENNVLRLGVNGLLKYAFEIFKYVILKDYKTLIFFVTLSGY